MNKIEFSPDIIDDDCLAIATRVWPDKKELSLNHLAIGMMLAKEGMRLASLNELATFLLFFPTATDKDCQEVWAGYCYQRWVQIKDQQFGTSRRFDPGFNFEWVEGKNPNNPSDIEFFLERLETMSEDSAGWWENENL